MTPVSQPIFDRLEGRPLAMCRERRPRADGIGFSGDVVPWLGRGSPGLVLAGQTGLIWARVARGVFAAYIRLRVPGSVSI
jgi:hypothetical protein